MLEDSGNSEIWSLAVQAVCQRPYTGCPVKYLIFSREPPTLPLTEPRFRLTEVRQTLAEGRRLARQKSTAGRTSMADSWVASSPTAAASPKLRTAPLMLSKSAR
jgi:hypothetical protein